MRGPSVPPGVSPHARRPRRHGRGHGPGHGRPGRGGHARRLGRWGLHRLGTFLVASTVLTALVLGLVQHRLRQGPLELPMLAELAAARLAAADDDGVTWRIGGAAFALGTDGAPSGVVFRDVAAFGPGGEPLAAAPLLSLDLALGDLLAGRLRPRGLELSGVSLTLLRRADGTVGLLPAAPGALPPPDAAGAPEGEDGAEGQADAVPDVPARADADPAAAPRPDPAASAAEPEAAALLVAADGPLAGLRRVTATASELILRDEITGRAWRLAGAELTLERRADGHALAVAGLMSPLDAPAGRPARPASRVAVAGTRAFADGRIAVEARFADVPLADIASAAPELAPLGALEAAASGELTLEQTAGGDLLGFAATLRLGPGRLGALEGAAGGFDAAEARLAWEPAARRLRLDRLTAEGPAGRLAASGALAAWPAPPGADPRAAPPGWRVTLALDHLALTEVAGLDAPLAFDAGALEADVIPGAARLEVARLALASPDLALVAHGAVEWGDPGLSVAAALRAEPFTAATLVAHWPPALAPGARRWLAANLHAGRVRDVEARLWLPPEGGAPEVTLDFAFAGVEATLVAGMPRVEGAAGRGRAILGPDAPWRLDLAFDAGRAAAPGRGAADFAGSRFAIPDLEADPPMGEAALAAAGRLPDLLAILDAPPLGLVSRLGADLSSLDGRAEVAARLSLPLLRDLRIADVRVAADAVLADVSGRVPGADLALTAERLALSADVEALALSGAIRLDGLPARVTWAERYGPDGPGRDLALSATLDGPTLRRLGLVAPQVEAGAVALELSLSGASSDPRLSLAARLDDAALALPAIGWRKPRGAPGRLTAEGRAGADGLNVERFRLEAGDLAAAGSARLGPDGSVRRVDLTRLVLGEALDVTLALTRAEDGALSAEVGGARIDLGALSRRASLSGGDADGGAAGDDGADPGPPLDAAIAVARLVAAEGFELHDARGRVLREAGATRARLRGKVNGGGPALVRWRDAPGEEPLLSLRTEDAGRMLGDLGLSGAAAGGRLVLRARIPRAGEGDVTGVAQIDGIRVADAAALGRVVDRAEADGLIAPRGAGPAEGEGWTFDSVRVPFTLAGGELRVEDATAVGAALGVKLEGAYDRAAERLDFFGVLTPAYAINGLLNRVPILGALLGGEGEGLFALTFTVEGPRAAPSISVNPFSVLAPGAFRRLLQPHEAPEAPPDLFEQRDMER